MNDFEKEFYCTTNNHQLTRQIKLEGFDNKIWLRARNGALNCTCIQTTYLKSPLPNPVPVICMRVSGPVLFPSEAPGSPTVTVIIEATSIIVRWTKPAADGGSPITGYRVLILRGNIEITQKNITDLKVKHLDVGGLTTSTNYTIKLFARNYVFEGNSTETKIQTKFQGTKILLFILLLFVWCLFYKIFNQSINQSNL